MTITVMDVRRWLDAEEPDYEGAKNALGSNAIPLLSQLIQGGDLGLASKATYLASLIPSPHSIGLLREAYTRNEVVLSVAAAAGIRNLIHLDAEQVFELLHADSDLGVRKVALTSSIGLGAPHVRLRVEALEDSDPEPYIRELAARVLKST